jgi:hypothetical protein
MLMDCHTHAFADEDLQVLSERLTFLDASLPEQSPHKWQIHGGGGLAHLDASQAAAGHDRYVLLPVTGKKERVGELNRWAAAAADDHPRLIPFGTLHPKGRVEEDLAELVALGIKGVKLHPFIQRFSLDEPETGRCLSLIAEAGLPLLLDTLFIEGLLKAKPHLDWVVQMMGFKGCAAPEVAAVATAHPSLRLVAAHMGSLYGWGQVGPLIELPNVYFDMSYVMGLLPEDELVRLIRAKGPDKVLYGTDAPWRDPVVFRAWFESLPLSPGEREQVGGGTLVELLGL